VFEWDCDGMHERIVTPMRRTDPEDTTRSYFRSRERVFCLNGRWFYSTREGDLGPFRSKQEALAYPDDDVVSGLG